MLGMILIDNFQQNFVTMYSAEYGALLLILITRFLVHFSPSPMMTTKPTPQQRPWAGAAPPPPRGERGRGVEEEVRESGMAVEDGKCNCNMPSKHVS